MIVRTADSVTGLAEAKVMVIAQLEPLGSTAGQALAPGWITKSDEPLRAMLRMCRAPLPVLVRIAVWGALGVVVRVLKLRDGVRVAPLLRLLAQSGLQESSRAMAGMAAAIRKEAGKRVMRLVLEGKLKWHGQSAGLRGLVPNGKQFHAPEQAISGAGPVSRVIWAVLIDRERPHIAASGSV